MCLGEWTQGHTQPHWAQEQLAPPALLPEEEADPDSAFSPDIQEMAADQGPADQGPAPPRVLNLLDSC